MRLLIAGILIVTGLAFGAPEQANSDGQVLARVDGNYEGMSAVAITADGRLQIVSQEGRRYTHRLPERVFNRLRSALTSVANVKVKSSVQQAVCGIMTPPIGTLYNLSVSKHDVENDSFSGNPRLLVTQIGCWLERQTYPVDDVERTAVESIRDQIVTLALYLFE